MGDAGYPDGMDHPVKPSEWQDRLRLIADKSEDAKELAQAGARKDLQGFRVPGHRISMKGERIRVTGPMAPAVAAEVSKRAAKGMEDALRGLLK